jgi:hypothetical protein
MPADVGEVRIAINADKPEIGSGELLHKNFFVDFN